MDEPTTIDDCLSPPKPGFVQVTFPYAYLDDTIPDATNPPVYVVQKTVLEAAESAGIGSPGGMTFHDQCFAYFETVDSDDPLNDSNLQDLTLRIAKDFYNYQSVAHDLVYNGVVDWESEGTSDCIEITYDANNITTRVYSGAINCYPEEFCHFDIEPPSSGSSSESFSGSSSSSGPFTGEITVVTNESCSSGTMGIYTETLTYVDGIVTHRTGSTFSHSAGCCDCPSSSGGG